MIGIWMLSKEKYQNILTQKATKYLSEKLKTKVEIDHVNFTFFNNFNIKGVYIEDDKKDTLAYIGTIQLKSTDLLANYWNDEPSILKEITIENVNVYLNRKKDSIWNYNFIEKAFEKNNTDSTSTVEKKDTKPSNNPVIDFKNVAIKNVRFFMDDGWAGEDMRFAFNQFDLQIDSFDLEKKKIELGDLIMSEANIVVKEYDGNRPKRKKIIDSTEWGTAFNPDFFSIKSKKIQLKNSFFSYDDGNKIPNPKEFDETHLAINNLNIDLENTKIMGDTIFSSIKNITAKERCGIVINEFSANAKVSQVQTKLSNLMLKTNYSTVSDYYEMTYKNFHDFEEYIDKVNMIAHLQNSSVSSLDIGYFANTLNQYPIKINIAGSAHGTVKDMYATNLQLATLNTKFNGNTHVVGLPAIDNTIFDIQSNELVTNGNDLNKLIPQTKIDAIAWNDLKKINFKGSYKGKVDEFTAKGNLATNLGNAKLDLKMNFKPKKPTYAGEIETENFQLGKLVKQKTIGNISVKGKIDGQGFDMKSLDAKVNATVKQIIVEGIAYNDLTINGLVSNNKFDGIFISKDEKLGVNFNGKLDLTGKQPSYNFNSRFLSINLQKLGITKEPIIASGYATLNFTGDNIDNFTGSALLKNISITNKNQHIYADQLLLESNNENKIKTLKLTSSIADATLIGNFNISQLPTAFQLYLYNYLPEYIKRPAHFKDQSFVFKADIKSADSILKTFMPSLNGISGSTIDGELNTFTQKLALDANIPSIGYNNLQFKNVVLIGGGDFNSLDVNATTQNLLYNEEVIIPSMQINTSMAHDTASLTINTQSINDLLGDASINCKATAFNNDLYINLLPSKFSIKEDSWQFYSKNNIVISDLITVQDLIIENGAQRITFNSENTTKNNLRINVDELDLEGISNYTGANPKYFGRISGVVNATNYTEEPMILANIFSNEEVRIDNDTVGLVKVQANFDVKNKLLTIDKNTSIERNGNFANAVGFINGVDSTINLSTNLNKQSISFLNQFLSEYIQNLKGLATGNVVINGKINSPTITGNIDLENAALKVLFLGTTYFIDNAKMKFNNRKIEMNNFLIRDERNENYTGIVKGYITHNNFSDFFLNFNVNSNNFLCLNTKETDNELFYGYVPAKINVDLTGPLDDIYVDMDVKPLKGSKFNLPINSSSDASTYDYVHYRQLGHFQNANDNIKKSSSYVKLNMNIEATPDAETSIILDANTGEQIVAKGNGNIRLIVDLGNSIEMYGAYIITEGKYLFNFRGLLNKEFAIDEGSKITWNGDALDAKMNINAIYKLPQSKALYPLVAGLEMSDEEKKEAQKPYPTFVSIIMTNSLSNPDIKFDITQPDNKSVGSLAYTKLEQIKNDDKELFAQAGVLLLFNDFKSPGGNISSSSYSQGAVSTVSDVVTRALSNELNNQLQKLGLKNLSLNLGYQNSNNYSSLNGNGTKNEVSVNVTSNFFDNRLIVDFANSIDIGRDPSANNSNNNFVGDFKAQYLITKDGRLRLNTYANNTPDLSGNNYNKGGAGLSYRKVFNSFSDLFVSKKKKAKRKEKMDFIKNDSLVVKK